MSNPIVTGIELVVGAVRAFLLHGLLGPAGSMAGAVESMGAAAGSAASATTAAVGNLGAAAGSAASATTVAVADAARTADDAARRATRAATVATDAAAGAAAGAASDFARATGIPRIHPIGIIDPMGTLLQTPRKRTPTASS